MKDLQNRTGRIVAVHSEPLNLNGSFQDFCRPFAAVPGTVILQSGGHLDCARYNILATLPWLTLSVKRRDIRLTMDGKTLVFNDNPWEILQELVTALRPEDGGLPEPVAAGLFGYLAYDLKDTTEKPPDGDR